MHRNYPLLVLSLIVLLLAGACTSPETIVTPTKDATPTTVALLADTPVASSTTNSTTPPQKTALTQPLSVTPSPTPTTPIPSVEDTLKTILNTERPPRDLYDLGERLKLKPGETITKVVNTTSPDYSVGHQDSFVIVDQQTHAQSNVTASIRIKTAHAYFYVQDGEKVDQATLTKAADAFENDIYPEVHRYFGSEWSPGVDNDPHITILNAQMPDPSLGGYFSASDEYPKTLNPASNEREMIYVNLATISPASDFYVSTLAHEFQHMVHWNLRASDDGWINEGASQMASELAGYDAGGFQSRFLASPDTQLNSWSDDPTETLAHYGAAYLFMTYLAERSGGYESIKDIITESGSGIERFDRYLSRKNLSLNSVFADWTVANFIDDPTVENGRYAYQNIASQITNPEKSKSGSAVQSGTVHQYAADYIEIPSPSSDVEVDFDGADTVKIVPNDAHSGQMQWWSNRGDTMDSKLTRQFDLSSVSKATLQFWMWHDIEKDWDYAYVMVSDDGGKAWKTVVGQSTTSTNPVGNNLGNGYTGTSGGGTSPSWVKETVDLSAYAGKQVQIRFEYVTDDAYNGNGICVDDISIPEIGFQDSVEDASQWETNGFIRLRNSIPQQFEVRLITKQGQYKVQTVSLDSEQKGKITIPGGSNRPEEAILVVAATSPDTTELASYQYSVHPTNGN